MRAHLALLIVGFFTLLVVQPVAAEPSEEDTSVRSDAERATPSPSEPRLNLERLLSPPRPKMPARRIEQRAGKDREAWTEQFSDVQGEIQELEARITKAQSQIREASSGEWGFTPTGEGSPSDPEVLRLRAELRRDRQSLDAARQRLRDLEVEASLAGVPDSWRQQPD